MPRRRDRQIQNAFNYSHDENLLVQHETRTRQEYLQIAPLGPYWCLGIRFRTCISAAKTKSSRIARNIVISEYKYLILAEE
jgi:hypothetical protein